MQAPSSPCDPSSAPWRSVAWLALGFALLRVAYLAFLSPYELAADEAHYWEWARRPALSYYSKGPGIAWTILAGTTLLGDTELGVRLFAALFSGVTTFAVGLTAARFASPSLARSAAITAALLFNAVPAYQVTSVLMTIDGPYLACWALAMSAAWRMHRRAHEHKLWCPADAAWLGLALGVGFLYKYTILLFIPGLTLHLALQRRALGQARGAPLAGLLVLVVFVACTSPVLIWNHLEGWPTVKHLLGHANIQGGDIPQAQRGYDPRWTLEYLGTQLGILGPFACWLIIRAVRRSPPSAPSPEAKNTEATSPEAPTGDAPPIAPGAVGFAACLALPTLVFYLFISFRTDIEGNWPIACYLSLISLAGAYTAHQLAKWRQAVKQWRALPEPRPRAGRWTARPSHPDQVAWHWALGFGLAACLVTHAMPWFKPLPIIGPKLPVHRLSGHRLTALELQDLLKPLTARSTPDAPQPLLIADHYMIASLLAFYTPGHPVLRSAASRLGNRKNQYDHFPDTRIDESDLAGREVVLVGADAKAWRKALSIEQLRQRGEIGRDGRRWAVFTARFKPAASAGSSP